MPNEYQYDVFISYSHIDNQPYIEGNHGWVTLFHQILEKMLHQKMGEAPAIWRDMHRIGGNSEFRTGLVEVVAQSATMVCVITPRYVKSDWCDLELNEFVNAANGSLGLTLDNLSRIFKVVKTPGPAEDQPSAIKDLPGYNFFIQDKESGKVKELNADFGAVYQQAFFLKIDDLSIEVKEMLDRIRDQKNAIVTGIPIVETPVATGPAIYLAEVGHDVEYLRDELKRELEVVGFQVIPDQALPMFRGPLRDHVKVCLSECILSIHLLGRKYSHGPKDSSKSMEELQFEIAGEQDAFDRSKRIVWIPSEFSGNIQDVRQKKLIEMVRNDMGMDGGTEIFETSTNELVHYLLPFIQETERNKSTQSWVEDVNVVDDEESKQIYLVHAEADSEDIIPLKNHLFDLGFELMLPAFEGNLEENRVDHEENLVLCDAVLIYFGKGKDNWFNAMLKDVKKAPAFGRKTPFAALGVCLAPPISAPKTDYRSRKFFPIDMMDGFSPERLIPFIEHLQNPPSTGTHE